MLFAFISSGSIEINGFTFRPYRDYGFPLVIVAIVCFVIAAYFYDVEKAHKTHKV
jgi:hypothetical protein